ncbi:MAG: Tm-1-like ATP-binding domain-containing protein, partial [Desulfatiglandaceae bacterium]
RGIGPRRFEPPPERNIPRLVVPGGLDCAVLEFTRENIPQPYRNRKIFFYDFRSAVRLTQEETRQMARQLAQRLNKSPSNNQILIPLKGWSEADCENGPLYDVEIRDAFIREIKSHLHPEIKVRMLDLHINDAGFAQSAAEAMDTMIRPIAS